MHSSLVGRARAQKLHHYTTETPAKLKLYDSVFVVWWTLIQFGSIAINRIYLWNLNSIEMAMLSSVGTLHIKYLENWYLKQNQKRAGVKHYCIYNTGLLDFVK